MLAVIDVLVSPSSVVTEFCDGFSCCSGQEFFGADCTVTQEEVRYESSQVKAPPLSRRRMMPPTPLQSSYSSFEEEQEDSEVEDQMWSARYRAVIARTKRYLEVSQNMKVEIEAAFLVGSG